MRLIERKLKDLSNLHYKIFTCSLPKRSHLDAIVVTFEGEYGYGSKGDGDAHFMAAIIKAALVAWRTSALVIDLRKMTYEWGDLIAMAIAAGQDQYIDAPFPTAIIVSDHNRTGLTSLIRDEILGNPSEWLYNTLKDAINAVEERME